MPAEVSVAEKIKHLGLDTRSAQRVAREGKIEVWVHNYLMRGEWANPEFSRGLRRQERWWKGPVEVSVTDLSPAVGPQPGMEYRVEVGSWYARIRKMAKSMTDPLSIPPLIIEYRSGELSVRDGNTRHGAMNLLGWPTCWVVIWYNTESDYHQHSSLLLGSETV